MEGVRGLVRLSRGKRLPVPATLQEEHADTGDAEEQIDPPGLDQESERESGGYHEERGAIDAAGSLEREVHPARLVPRKSRSAPRGPRTRCSTFRSGGTCARISATSSAKIQSRFREPPVD